MSGISGDSGALVDGKLPPSVTLHPDRAAPGLFDLLASQVSSCRAIGHKSYSRRQLSYRKIAKQRRFPRRLVLEFDKDRSFVERISLRLPISRKSSASKAATDSESILKAGSTSRSSRDLKWSSSCIAIAQITSSYWLASSVCRGSGGRGRGSGLCRRRPCFRAAAGTWCCR